MAYTEVITQSWGRRLGNALKSVLAGLALITTACVLLFWNEGRAVKTDEPLSEAERRVVPVESNATVNPDMDKKLVHMSGTAVTRETLTDKDFSFSLPAISLRRRVEYYQWVEHSETHEEKEMGGSTRTVTTYTYSQKWCEEPEKSIHFHEPGHNNLIICEVADEDTYADRVQFGAFHLSSKQIHAIGNAQKVDLSSLTLEPRPGCRYCVNGNCLTITDSTTASATVSQGEEATPEEGSDVGEQSMAATPSPRIGDVRVTWEYVAPEQVLSLIAVQTGDTFTPYLTENGEEVSLLDMGEQTTEAMFAHARYEDTVILWLLRFLGWMMMFIGMRCLFSIISVILGIIPFLGNLAKVGLGILSFLLSLVFSLVIIAVAWFWYRPLLSACLISIAAACVFLIRCSSKKAAAQPTPAP